MATSKAVAKTSQAPRRPARTEVVVASFPIEDVPTKAQVIEAIASGSKLYFDGDETTGSILPGILANAENPLDVFAVGELEKVEDHYGEVLTILSIDGVRNSDFEGGLGIYLVVSAATVEGEVIRLAVGQMDPVAKLAALNEMNAFPWKVAFEQSEKATKGGFHPVNLVSRQPQEKTALRAGERSF